MKLACSWFFARLALRRVLVWDMPTLAAQIPIRRSDSTVDEDHSCADRSARRRFPMPSLVPTQTAAASRDAVSSEIDAESEVRAVFDAYWSGVDKARFDTLYARRCARAPWFHRPFVCGAVEEIEIMQSAFGAVAGRSCLEFGSGIGWTSLALARAGATVSVVDISAKALELSQRAFARAGCSATWIQSSIFHPTPALERHDVVFNSGLIEHFRRDDQVRMLANMRDLTLRGGYVVVFAPYRGGRLYTWAKRRLEVTGGWRFGDEFPVQTLVDLGTEVGLDLVQETTAKPGDQINFLFGINRLVCRLAKLIYLATLADCTPLWRLLIGDSMIATVFRKR